jgi:hypothetical protein
VLGQFDAAQRSDHLIFLATGADQARINGLFATAPAADGVMPQPGPGIFEGDLTDLSLYTALKEPFGLLFTSLSPVEPGRAVLAVISDTQAGFEATMDGLLSTLPPVTVSGTVAVVQPDHGPVVVYGPEDVAALTQPVEVPGEPAPVAQTPTETTSTTTTSTASDSLSKIDASVAIIIIPIAVSLFLLLAIWVFQRGRGNS